MTQENVTVRGSQKLLEEFRKRGVSPTTEDIKKAVALKDVDFKLIRWLHKGVPPAYLEFDATLQVKPAHIGALVDRFVALNDSNINYNILINGIPFPEIAEVRIRNTPGE